MKKGNRLITVAIALLALCNAVSQALFGLCLGKTLDIMEAHLLNQLALLLLVMIALAFVDFVSTVWMYSLIYKSASKSVCRLKNHVYRTQMEKKRGEMPDMAGFTSKIDMLHQNYYVSGLCIVVEAAAFVCSCVAIIYINWIMFIIAFISSLIPFIVPVIFKGAVQRAADCYSRESSRYTGFVSDTLFGRLELVKYNVTMRYIEKHGVMNEKLERSRAGSLRINYIAEASTFGVANLMYAAVLMTGGILVFRGSITIGNVLSVVQLMNYTVLPITYIVGYVNKINACKPVLKELEEGTSESDSAKKEIQLPQAGTIREKGLLRAEHIAFSYEEEGKKVIDDFSYEFKAGGKYLMKGASGGGKSTLAKLLSGELLPQSGNVTIDGQEVSLLPVEKRNELINYAEQKSYLFQDDVKHNITLYRECDEDNLASIRRQMDMLSLQSIELLSQINDGEGLSGGERARVCLLRAMYDMPEILIADEPTSALDRQNTKKVIEFLCSCPQTVIVIAHNLDDETEKQFDDVLVIG